MAFEPVDGLPRPLAVVAHDAGAVNVIIAWLAASRCLADRAVMLGPARSLWLARFGDEALVDTPEAALSGARCLLSGTGWASDLEHRARQIAQRQGVHSVAAIDHWTNYRARFERGGETVLPDIIWVGDEDALAEAQRALPEVEAAILPNLYLAQQAALAGPCPVNGYLLYVAEPVRSNWGREVAGEFQALAYLVAHRSVAGIPPDMPIVIRPHPSEDKGKYVGWIAANPGFSLDNSADLASAMRASSWVAGMQSFALVVALEAGRKVLSCLPPWAPACVLPHRGIVHLKEFAGQ